MLTESLHYCTLLLKKFLLFSTVPISIETVIPIRTTIAVHLMIPFTVHAFENIRTKLAFFGGYLICFLIIYTTSHFLSVMFGVVCSIAFCTSGDMRVSTKYQITPFPAVFTLWNIWVHISTIYGSDESFYVEMIVNNILSWRTTLGIPDVHPNHCYIRFRGHFNDTCIVTLTYWNDTCSMLTSAKLSVGYLVVEITRELDKELSLHCSSIYINTTWSILQQYLLALMSMSLPHVLLLRPPCRMHVLWHHTSLISIIYVYTICTPWGTLVSWHHS